MPTLTSTPLAGHGGAMLSAQIIPLRDHRRALAVQSLTRAVHRRDVAATLARGALGAVEILAAHAVTVGGLDHAGVLGLQLAVLGARDAAAELADAHRAVEVLAGDTSDA